MNLSPHLTTAGHEWLCRHSRYVKPPSVGTRSTFAPFLPNTIMSTTASSLASAPFFLWNLYLEHLWDYKPGSWVQRTASSFRVLAFIVIMPFAILTLLVRLFIRIVKGPASLS